MWPRTRGHTVFKTSMNSVSLEDFKLADIEALELPLFLLGLAARRSVFLEDSDALGSITLALRGGQRWSGFPMNVQELSGKPSQLTFLVWEGKSEPSWLLLPLSEIQSVEIQDLPRTQESLRLLSGVEDCTRLETARFSASLKTPWPIQLVLESFPEDFRRYGIVRRLLENLSQALASFDGGSVEAISKAVNGIEVSYTQKGTELSVANATLKFSSNFSECALLRNSSRALTEQISKLF